MRKALPHYCLYDFIIIRSQTPCLRDSICVSAPTLPVVDQLEHLLQHHDHAGVMRPVVARVTFDGLDGLVDHALVDRDLVPFDAARVEVS